MVIAPYLFLPNERTYRVPFVLDVHLHATLHVTIAKKNNNKIDEKRRKRQRKRKIGK